MRAYFLLLLMSLSQGTFGTEQRSTLLASAEWAAALHSIVESEHAFCRAAAEKGTKAAFLAFMAEDAVLFRPQPVPGKKWMYDRPAPPGRLSWRPIFADISAAGDLGYTTGPYEFRKDPADPVPASHGNYMTIWKKQDDGSWKILIDHGSTNPPPDKPIPDFDPLQAKSALLPSQAASAGAVPDVLTGLDRRLSSLSATKGPLGALGPYLADEIRFMRTGRQPALGKSEVQSLLPSEPGIWVWQPMKSEGSISGDLGYTYGTFQLQPGKSADRTLQSGYYLRIWKKRPGGEWRMVLDIVTF